MDQKDLILDKWMARLLQTGVLLAALTMFVGGGLFLARHGSEIPDYRNFHGVAPDVKNFNEIWRGVTGLRGRGIIQFGVLLMIATPVLRVAFAIAAFALERDWLYSAISCLVLSLLLYALWIH